MEMDRIRSLLESKGLKVTPQRMVILEFLTATHSHPTADEVWQAVEKLLPAISKATVYNTLNALVEANAVHAISTEPGKARYDANLEAHHHFIDTRTGAIHDIPWDRVDQLCQSLGDEFKISDYQITFYGEHAPGPG